MVVIGLLGGVASGKSFAARHLVSLGGELLDADRTGHEVLDEAEVKQAITDRWGSDVLAADGSVDRKRVAEIVFEKTTGPHELRVLEQITHPRIGERLNQRVAELRESGTPAVVLDAPVMLKAHWDRFCDCLLFIDAPHDVRLARAAARGWGEGKLDARESAQTSLAEKRAKADVIIPSADADETRQHLDRFWRERVAPLS